MAIKSSKTQTTQSSKTPNRIVMERRMVVAEVPVETDGNVHPFVALLQETAEALHQQWASATSRGIDDYGSETNSTGMESITDNLVAEWNGTRLSIDFSPIED